MPALGIALGLWAGIWLLNLVILKFKVRIWTPCGYSLRKVVIASIVASTLIIPHLYGFQRQHGDWRWPSYGYARWNANIEFPERLGTAGFPTKKEFQQSPYAGPRISYAQYLFGLHTPVEVVTFQLLGWFKLLFFQALSSSDYYKAIIQHLINFQLLKVLRFVSFTTILAAAIGVMFAFSWFRMLIDQQMWWAPLMVLWATLYAAFLYHLKLVEPLRHTVHIYPLFIMITLMGIAIQLKSDRKT